MRHVFFLIIATLTIATYGQDQDLEAIIKGEKKAFAAKQNFKSKRSGQLYDIIYHKMKLNIDPSVRLIKGSVYSELIALEPNFTNFSFDLDVRMTVDSVVYNGNLIPFFHQNDEVSITIAPQNSGAKIAVEIYYKGDPSENEQFGFNYDFTLDGPIAWTLSEPYGAYGWWPCKQQLNDKIDSIDFEFTIPKGNKAAGLGLLQRVDTLADSSLVFHWKHRYPVTTYLVSVTVTNFYEQSFYIPLSGGDSVYHLDYLYPAYKPAADTLSLAIHGMMRAFDSLFGDYPFKKEKYGHAQFARGGGMEHQTMSSMSDLRFDLMAHELIHQWFGNKITCGSWGDLWLNEGWATYGNGIARELVQGKAQFLDFLITCNQRITRNTDGSVYAYDTLNVNNLFFGDMRYRKGAMVLHQLRWELGDDIFFQAARDYLENVSLCYGFAYTADYKAALELASGKDLTAFFDRYIYKEGWPTVTTTWNRMPGGKLNLNISQVSSHPSVSFYPLKIEYQAKGEGRDTFFVVDHSVNDENFTVHLGFKVDELIYDPNVWLISKDSMSEGMHVDITNITVFPNPTNETLHIYIPNQKLDEVTIYDIQGRLVLQQTFDDTIGSISTINVSSLSDGVYCIKSLAGDNAMVSKFIKAVNN
jgi:aminopeptidase N